MIKYFQMSRAEIEEELDIVKETIEDKGYDNLERANEAISLLVQHLENVLDSLNDERDLGEWFIHQSTIQALSH